MSKIGTLAVLGVMGLVAFGAAACGGESAEEQPQVAEAQAAAAGAMEEAGEMAGAGMEAAEEAAEAMPQELPEGVTAEMIDEGDKIFHGSGICMSCHGANGEGIPSLGADLTDDEWLHSDGSYDGIVKSVAEGVTAQESSSGVPMPAKGGTSITDEQVKAVAAYVWSLSR